MDPLIVFLLAVIVGEVSCQHTTGTHADENFCGVYTYEGSYGQGPDLSPILRNTGTCVNNKTSAGLLRPRKCPTDHLCVSSKASKDEFYDFSQRHVKITSSTGCLCIDPQSPCRRINNIEVYHEGTMHEKSVDVGRCVGGCQLNQGHDKKCHPSSNTAVNVLGPNGFQCVQKIISCACSDSCHRLSYKKIYKTLVIDKLTGTNVTKDMVVDIGRCSGKCDGKKKKKCLYWMTQQTPTGPQKVCVLHSSVQMSCLPAKYRSQPILTVDGQRKTIKIMENCACT